MNINTFDYNKQAIIYALPKSVVHIKVEISKISKHKAPFAAYAKKYLGITDAILKDESEYKISNISFSTSPVLDTSCIYAIYSKKHTAIQQLNLTKEGFIAGVNLSNFSIKQNLGTNISNPNRSEQNFKLRYSDYSLKPQLETLYDTLYKEVFQDSIYVKVPIVRKQMVNKSTERQAQELADQIFLLRDDRNALIKGESDGDEAPNGEALKIMIEQLNKLEDEYMSLFTGKVTTNSKSYSFSLTPEKNSLHKRVVLFKFSKKNGIQNKNSSLGKAVQLEILSRGNTTALANYQQKANIVNTEKKVKFNGLFYRLPENANFYIWYNSKKIATQLLTIPQYGVLKQLPANAINKDTQIEFYPYLGAIKRIATKNN